MKEAKVLFSSSKLKVHFDEEAVTVEQIKCMVQKLGYPVLESKEV
ncbi:hypothetical protein [Paenibacillus sp. DMB20]